MGSRIWEIDWYQNEWPWPLFRGRIKVMPTIALHSTLNRVVATVIGTLADARTCLPNIILWQLVLDVPITVAGVIGKKLGRLAHPRGKVPQKPIVTKFCRMWKYTIKPDSISGLGLVSINIVVLRRARLILGWVTDHLWAGKPSRYVTCSHLGQLSLSSLQGRLIDYTNLSG